MNSSREALRSAVRMDAYENVENLLKDGHKLKIEDLDSAFKPVSGLYCVSQKTIDLLAAYHALPEGISAATIKAALYFREKFYNVDLEDFIDEQDLNLEGCPGLWPPIDSAISDDHIENARFLINAGVKRRPLNFSLGFSESHLLAIDLLKLESYKIKISEFLNHRDIVQRSLIIELLLMSPSELLDEEIRSANKLKYYFICFFAWAAKNNRSELIKSDGFAKLLMCYPEAAYVSFQLAALFGSVDFIVVDSIVMDCIFY